MEDVAKRILIMDDEPPLLRMMTVYLRRLGYSVTTCGSTEEAAALIEAQPGGFDAAVLDGSMDGLGVVEMAFRVLSANPRACVVAASGFPVDISAPEAAAPGRVAFLHKPFTPEMLAATMRRMIGPEKETEI
jgi:DNA-binding NtrC family response regulator